MPRAFGHRNTGGRYPGALEGHSEEPPTGVVSRPKPGVGTRPGVSLPTPTRTPAQACSQGWRTCSVSRWHPAPPHEWPPGGLTEIVCASRDDHVRVLLCLQKEMHSALRGFRERRPCAPRGRGGGFSPPGCPRAGCSRLQTQSFLSTLSRLYPASFFSASHQGRSAWLTQHRERSLRPSA